MYKKFYYINLIYITRSGYTIIYQDSRNYSDRKEIMTTKSRLPNDQNMFEMIHMLTDPMESYINQIAQWNPI